MKKIMKLMSLLLLLAITQYSCINDADVINPDIMSEQEGNLAFSFEIPNSSTLTRANSAESSDENETGSENEYNVSSVTVYLFDAQTKIYAGSYDLQNIRRTSSLDETTKYISYTTNKITVEPGTYNLFAIANGKTTLANISTQDKFLDAIDATTYRAGAISSAPTKGFVMTNRGSANLNIKIEKTTTANNAIKMSVRLERVVAKIELTQAKNEFPLLDKNDSKYATIKISNFKIVNLATQFYTFRHTAVLNSFQKPDAYTDENFGEISNNNGYVIDPYFFNKSLENAKDFTNSDGFFAQALLNSNESLGWSPMGGVNNWSFIYCLENCMYQNAQVNGYTTGVMFQAHIEVEPNHVFNENGIENNQANWGKMLFYFNCNFYTSINALRKQQINNLPGNINDESTDEVLTTYNIKRFSKKDSNYTCFYNYWIKHLDNNVPSESGVMEFGIVRNNIYRLSITKIAGLGTGNPFIDPEQPDEPKAELEIDLDVFPWAIRKQDVELE